jgi:hypothetical protein
LISAGRGSARQTSTHRYHLSTNESSIVIALITARNTNALTKLAT